MKRRRISALAAPVVAAFFSACTPSPKGSLRSELPPAQLTAVQARIFQTVDQKAVIRAVGETVMEGGFVVDRIDPQGKV